MKAALVPILDRLSERSEAQGDCLVWTGATMGPGGYGMIAVDGKTRTVNTQEAWDRGLRRRPAEPKVSKFVALDADQARWLARIAEAEHVSESYILRRCVRTAMCAGAQRGAVQ